MLDGTDKILDPGPSTEPSLVSQGFTLYHPLLTTLDELSEGSWLVRGALTPSGYVPPSKPKWVTAVFLDSVDLLNYCKNQYVWFFRYPVRVPASSVTVRQTRYLELGRRENLLDEAARKNGAKPLVSTGLVLHQPKPFILVPEKKVSVWSSYGQVIIQDVSVVYPIRTVEKISSQKPTSAAYKEAVKNPVTGIWEIEIY